MYYLILDNIHYTAKKMSCFFGEKHDTYFLLALKLNFRKVVLKIVVTNLEHKRKPCKFLAIFCKTFAHFYTLYHTLCHFIPLFATKKVYKCMTNVYRCLQTIFFF